MQATRTGVVLVGAVVFLALAAAVLLPLAADSPVLGLSSTKLSLEPEGTEDISAWSIPGGKTYSDIEWSSSDETVVTVTGGTVKGVGLGTATVTASVAGISSDCLVTVSETVEDNLTVYNPYSADYDCAVLSGEGFLGDSSHGGVLALTYNEGGYVIISLAGYTWDWYGSAEKPLGNPESDFNRIVMKVLKDESEVAVSEYLFTSGSGHVFTTADGITYNSTAYTADMFVKGLSAGEYTAEFDMYKNSDDSDPTATVTGSFELREGDGRYDTTSEYTRSYAWRAAPDDTASAKTFSMNVTYSYSDYWNSVMKSKQKNIYYSNGLKNCTANTELIGFCTVDSSVTALGESLKTAFSEQYPALSTEGQEYAQFLLGFMQVSTVYEHDYAQNYNCADPESYTDVWAFPSMTLYTGMGDCEDTSILLTALYRHAGYDAGFYVFDDHVMSAVGLGTYDDYGVDAYLDKCVSEGIGYYPCETTCISPVFYIDDKSQPGKKVWTYSASFSDKTTIEKYTTHSYRLVGCVMKDQMGTDYQFIKME